MCKKNSFKEKIHIYFYLYKKKKKRKEKILITKYMTE